MISSFSHKITGCMTFKLHRKTRFYSFRSGAWTCNPSVDRQQIFRFLPRCAMYTTASWVWISHTVAPWIDEFRNGEKSWQKTSKNASLCFGYVFSIILFWGNTRRHIVGGWDLWTSLLLVEKPSEIDDDRAFCGVMSKIGCGILWLKEVILPSSWPFHGKENDQIDPGNKLEWNRDLVS